MHFLSFVFKGFLSKINVPPLHLYTFKAFSFCPVSLLISVVILYTSALKSANDWWCYKWLQHQGHLQHPSHHQMLILMGLDPPVLFLTTLMARCFGQSPLEMCCQPQQGLRSPPSYEHPYLRVSAPYCRECWRTDLTSILFVPSVTCKLMSGIFGHGTPSLWASSDQGQTGCRLPCLTRSKWLVLVSWPSKAEGCPGPECGVPW